jgi:radical SAM protein with 4Fe4S-binding SPASM domain
MERPRQAMKMGLFEKVVDEAVLAGSTSINFSVMIGDPLLDPQLLQRAKYIKTYPQVRETGFTTTLQWLHLFDLDDFFRADFKWIVVSTTLSGREQYRTFFGVDKYDQMLANLITLLKENNRRGQPIRLELSIKPTPERREDILRHPHFQLVQSLTAENLVAKVKRENFFVFDWGGSVKLPDYLRLFPLVPRKHRPCNRLLQSLMVYSNGKVGACNCVDFEASTELILGNVEETPLMEMWDSTHLAQLRSDWKAGTRIPVPCRQCRMYNPKPGS